MLISNVIALHSRLKVKRAAVKAELQKASTGALGSILKQHASSVLVTECESCLYKPLLRLVRVMARCCCSDYLGRWDPKLRR